MDNTFSRIDPWTAGDGETEIGLGRRYEGGISALDVWMVIVTFSPNQG